MQTLRLSETPIRRYGCYRISFFRCYVINISDAYGVHTTQTRFQRRLKNHDRILQRWRASDLPALVDRINKYSIGLDDYFDRLAELNGTATNYPPYNLVQVSNVEYRLELALAGFKKTDVKVYTEHGRDLYVEGKKESDEHSPEYLHRGVDQRSFSRAWSLSDETEVRSVTFKDGLLSITLGKVVPDHHQRKDYL